MTRYYHKPLSFLLALILTVCSIPVASAPALALDELTPGDMVDISEGPQEDASLRDAFTKHYIGEDGYNYAVVCF